MLTKPLRWTKSKMVFVNSISDLFHEQVPDKYIESVARVMREADWHVFQVLTKRSERMRDLLRGRLRWAAQLPRIWWGVSVENRKHGLPRINHLRAAKPAMAFLSIEPLLEDLGKFSLRDIHWVIVGGESGSKRAMEKAWVIKILAQCRDAQVPFFLKQWGGFRKSAAGRRLDSRTYDELPELAFNPVPNRAGRQAMIDEITRSRVAAWTAISSFTTFM